MKRALSITTSLVCAGLLVAACSSGPSSHTATGTTGSGKSKTKTNTKTKNTIGTTTTAVSAATTTTTAASGTATTTTAAPGIAACAQVTATPGQTQGAAGTIVGTITLAEVGTSTCTIKGYPTIVRQNAAGAVVATSTQDGLTVNLSGPATQPPSLVTLTPAQQAEFTYQYSDVPTGEEPTCPTSATVSVTTPGATAASAPVALAMTPCSDIQVSPVYAG